MRGCRSEKWGHDAEEMTELKAEMCCLKTEEALSRRKKGECVHTTGEETVFGEDGDCVD